MFGTSRIVALVASFCLIKDLIPCFDLNCSLASCPVLIRLVSLFFVSIKLLRPILFAFDNPDLEILSIEYSALLAAYSWADSPLLSLACFILSLELINLFLIFYVPTTALSIVRIVFLLESLVFISFTCYLLFYITKRAYKPYISIKPIRIND